MKTLNGGNVLRVALDEITVEPRLRLVREAQVSNVLRAKYTGNLAAVEDLVRGHFFAETIRCPALGDISKAACRDWMRAAARFSNINSERVRMFRACNGCPRMQKDAAA